MLLQSIFYMGQEYWYLPKCDLILIKNRYLGEVWFQGKEVNEAVLAEDF